MKVKLKTKPMTFLLTIFSLIIVYVGFVAVLYLAQGLMVYQAPKSGYTPAQMGRNDVEIVHVTTADGVRLEGWYRPRKDKTRRTIVLFHGNGDYHQNAIHWMQPHLDKGDGVLALEYRGYAGNPGKPSEQGLYKDGRAWIDWLKTRGVPVSSMVLYGQSIGTGVAVQMATEYRDAFALILYAPFTSLPAVAKTRYWFVPVDLLMRDRYDSLAKLPSIHMPVFIINGLADTLVNPAQGKALYDAANEPKELVQVPGYGHADVPLDLVGARVEHFLDGLKK
jgi:fermentation-respiration switch protein FrsA (DUF1100 family)